MSVTMDKSNSESFFDIGDGGSYDAVVVGSGYGGSVAACRMSMAGFRVCLLEKGRRWEAQDFPSNTLKMLSAIRVEQKKFGAIYGPKDALFQVYLQDDAAAVTACGLGGGSLVNGGVILRTPVRARRDLRWPKAWEKDWDRYEASATDMLRAQNLPMKFQTSKVIEKVISKEYDSDIHNPIKLTMNFDMEEQVIDSKRSQEMGSCLACGNCLAGCPYNAKYSTDKTYLASAVQAGCTILTECEVQHVVKNEFDACIGGKGKGQRQWLVFLDEFNYIASNIVILSAGVLGTTKILFESQLRGLPISQKLGSRLSCNGNNVAYLSGSSAPLNASGLNKEQFSSISFQKRPGPSISSSYVSSLGFTIQTAVIPRVYPHFLFKGVTSYRLRSDYWFLYSIVDWLKDILNVNYSQSMALNVMGHDDSNGRVMFDKESSRVFYQPPHDHLLPRKIEAFRKLAKKLGGALFMPHYRSTSVHLLGGCVASSDVSSGVCNPNGQVFDATSPTTGVHPGLYVCDASLIPCSIGINPSLTIAAVAEHVSRHLVQNATDYSANSFSRNSDLKPVLIANGKMKKSFNSEVMTSETLRGQVGGMLCTAYLKLRFKNQSVTDKTDMAVGTSHPLLCGKVGGYIECKAIETDKMYIVRGEVDLCKTDDRTPYTQYMHYHLVVAASSGSRYVLEGRKIMNPFIFALHGWRECTTLHVTLRKILKNKLDDDIIYLKGMLHLSPMELLKSICAFEGACSIKFMLVFMQSLIRTYILQAPRRNHMSFSPMELPQQPYPKSTTFEIKTKDNFTIHCQHWESSYESGGKKFYPVLLINGYATAGYWLPTEPNDLVRTLLKDGHDVWLLHTRVHLSSNDFTIEDIGRMDIPEAIGKIAEFYGESIKVHVVAHCVGGLSIHIALLGGHVSAKHIASLSCTNSSMFFKLTTSSLVKMWLPLLPVSMAILGKNKILPLLQTSPVSFRHRLLKFIALLLPRYERCTCNECEVFSGIFGNPFWHENISHRLHYWMNKEYQLQLPMAAFPHLRKICLTGHIVDSKGNNSYLIHPERMAVPTLYISGGRTLLVTPETSFLANKYMKLHQPGYRHDRVVVDGFGHSDLLLGEKSTEAVFPHIQKHIGLSEEERSHSKLAPRENKGKREALAWSCDPYEDTGRLGSLMLPFFSTIFLLLLFKFFFFS